MKSIIFKSKNLMLEKHKLNAGCYCALVMNRMGSYVFFYSTIWIWNFPIWRYFATRWYPRYTYWKMLGMYLLLYYFCLVNMLVPVIFNWSLDKVTNEFDPSLSGPSVVAINNEGVWNITEKFSRNYGETKVCTTWFPTLTHLLRQDKPVQAVREGELKQIELWTF